MFRHSVRHIVKPGEFNDFLEDFKRFNGKTSAAGLPAYRLWQTEFGVINEVWSEAEYDSLDAHAAAWDRARDDEELMTAFRAMISRAVPGSLHDYPLKPIDL